MAGMRMQHNGIESRIEEPVAVLYDAALLSLSRARQCITEDDRIGRVMEVKKVTNILTYLQATLRAELGRSATVSLSDFYAAMFTLTLEASQCGSTEGLDDVIGYISRVRDAWVLSRGEPKMDKALVQGLRPYSVRSAAMLFHA